MDGPDASGWYSLHRKLKAGTHEYKFVLDGKNWRQDPGNPRQTGYDKNSVLMLGGSP